MLVVKVVKLDVHLRRSMCVTLLALVKVCAL